MIGSDIGMALLGVIAWVIVVGCIAGFIMAVIQDGRADDE